MRRKAVIRTGLVSLLAIAAAGLFAVAGRADDPLFDQIDSSLQPSFVDAGGDVLYKAQWHYIDNPTLTHASVEITIPDGWTLVSSEPSGCVQNGTAVSCPWGSLHFGDLVAQEVRLRTDSDLGIQTVTSTLSFYEGPRNPGRRNRVDTPPRQTEVISADPAATPDKAGNCVGDGFSLGTEPGAGGSETTATAPDGTGELCTPITIFERPRINPTEFCIPGRECVTEIVTTEATPVSPTDPIQLKIVFRGTGLNSLPLIFTSETRQLEVPECTDPAVAAPDPCWWDHIGRQRSVTWFVNWTGNDPIWDS